ncbi:hypothetical protein AVEN_160936-1 [Araneus ventricosus]|uniref:Secreted protein n=1 Tax=Araneus ventricosus TaxID=182803 RepID=A0A4Y2JT19_ARAVE|nr:hypothetical protein AVEN_160936-1 [Araneus ventricosus]
MLSLIETVFLIVYQFCCLIYCYQNRPVGDGGNTPTSKVTRLRSSPTCNKTFGTNTNDRSSDSPAEKETNRTGWSHPLRTTATPPSTSPSPQQTSYRPVR